MLQPRGAAPGPSRTGGWLATAALTLTLVAACDDPKEPGKDAAVDAQITADASADAEVPDASGPRCGNHLREGAEVCDGTDVGSETCAGAGLPAGTLACHADCTLDYAGCAVCDDGICSDGETAVTCPADCGVVDVAAGATHTCAVLADGTVWCWGARDGHRMGGTGDVDTPVRVPGIDTAVSVTAGRHHTCVRTVLSEILCWGANGYGQVGVSPPSHEVFPPVQVATGREPRAGAYHTCVRASATEAHCWGRVYLEATTADAPVVIQGGSMLALGDHHTCHIENSTVLCLGWNQRGQLGLGDRAWRPTPEAVDGDWYILAVGTGSEHSCISYMTGDLRGTHCFGANDYGQLGIPPGDDQLTPVKVSSLPAQILDGGKRHTCAKDSPLPGSLYCWGHNARGQLGTGEVLSAYEFRRVLLEEVTDFSVGDEHTCAILDDQTLRCWGDNRSGQIGNGVSDSAVATPASPHRLGPAEEVTP